MPLSAVQKGAVALLSLLGAALYFVFVLPRWWVLLGDFPTTLATAGRIARLRGS